MKFIIFAGGTGRRLWPISRQKSPKQFESIIDGKSTLQLTVERILETYGSENIYISTNESYVELVQKQLPFLTAEHVIGEPVRRDLAAAVGLATSHVLQADPNAADEPMAIIWGDSYLDQTANFLQLLTVAENLLSRQDIDILFIGETPRFPNENLGWLGLGNRLGTIEETPYFQFDSLTYRPPLEVCKQIFAAQTHVWNTGYFVTTPAFVLEMYHTYQPEMRRQLATIQASIGQPNYKSALRQVYPTIAEMSFDDAVLVNVDPQRAVVLHGELGWSDPGTLYALKESINPDPQATVTLGQVITAETQDCLVYNYQTDKLLVAIGLDGVVVVNTDDAVLVVSKEHIPLVKDVVNGLDGTNLEKFS